MYQMSVSIVHGALHKLKLYPYKIAVQQKLKPPDYAYQKTFCGWSNSFVCCGMAKLDTVFFSVERRVLSMG